MKNDWNHVKDQFKAYWWALLIPFWGALILSALHISQHWASGLFILTTFAVLYSESNKSGIRRAFLSLLWSVVAFAAIAIAIEVLHGLLYLLQLSMGLFSFSEYTKHILR